jgi:hypothetical protein
MAGGFKGCPKLLGGHIRQFNSNLNRNTVEVAIRINNLANQPYRKTLQITFWQAKKPSCAVVQLAVSVMCIRLDETIRAGKGLAIVLHTQKPSITC